MKMLSIMVKSVQVWLDKDYNLCFEGDYPAREDIIGALCYIKGCRDK